MTQGCFSEDGLFCAYFMYAVQYRWIFISENRNRDISLEILDCEENILFKHIFWCKMKILHLY